MYLNIMPYIDSLFHQPLTDQFNETAKSVLNVNVVVIIVDAVLSKQTLQFTRTSEVT